MQENIKANNTERLGLSFNLVWGGAVIFLVYAVALSYFLYTYIEKQMVQSTVIAYEKAMKDYKVNLDRISKFSFNLASSYHELDSLVKSTEVEDGLREKISSLETSYKLEVDNRNAIVESLEEQLQREKSFYSEELKQKDDALKDLKKKLALVKSEKATLEKQKTHNIAHNKAPTVNKSSTNKETLALKVDIKNELETLNALKSSIGDIENRCMSANNPDDPSCLELARQKAEVTRAQKKVAYMEAKMKYVVN